jgi:hypothetical protein
MDAGARRLRLLRKTAVNFLNIVFNALSVASMRIGSVGVGGATGIGSAMNPTGSGLGSAVSLGRLAVRTERGRRFALMPFAIATDASETPDCLPASKA